MKDNVSTNLQKSDEEEKLYFVWLSQVLDFAKRNILEFFKDIYTIMKVDADVIEHSAKLIYDNKNNLLGERLGFFRDLEKNLIKNYSLENSKKIIEECAKQKIDIVPYISKNYPKKIKNIFNPPAVLYRKGIYRNVDDNLSIAMVGTRKASAYALKATYLLANDMATSNSIVVSGQAIGVDSSAHQGAIDAKGYTVAFAGCGLDFDYPKQNSKLRENIIKNGVVYSEHPPKTEPKGWHFPIRNRLISGFSDGVVIMEGNYRSGSLHTSEHALEQGRDVFALPGDIFSQNSEATFSLLKQGAVPIMSALDILEHYISRYGHKMNFVGVRRNYHGGVREKNLPNTNYSKKTSKPIKREVITVNIREKKILNKDELFKLGFLGEDVVIYDLLKDDIHLDEIANITGFDVAKVLSSLTRLEIENLAKSMPGRIYGLK